MLTVEWIPILDDRLHFWESVPIVPLSLVSMLSNLRPFTDPSYIIIYRPSIILVKLTRRARVLEQQPRLDQGSSTHWRGAVPTRQGLGRVGPPAAAGVKESHHVLSPCSRLSRSPLRYGLQTWRPTWVSLWGVQRTRGQPRIHVLHTPQFY